MNSPTPTLRDSFKAFAKIGLLSFGGPAGQIALMHKVLVEEKAWIDDSRFLRALNFCMLLPGPEAQQLAIYIGWLLHRFKGGVMAGLLFVLPGALVMGGLSLIYIQWHQLAWVAALFLGVKAAVLAIVVQALVRIARRVLKAVALVIIAALAFVGIHAFALPFPAIIILAALTGLLLYHFCPQTLPARRAGDEGDFAFASQATPSLARSLVTLVLGLVIWFAPLGLVLALAGRESFFFDEGLFFAKLAVVTFGGAYAVLAYMAQAAVEAFGWLSAPEMVDGLGLAETTPGPLILVVQFVGFLAAYHTALGLSPLTAAFLGAALASWMTFVPSFLWIFLGAPYIERLGEKAWANAMLTAITAAVVGVIANLAIWFGLHVLFKTLTPFSWGSVHISLPDTSSLDWRIAGLTFLSFMLLFALKRGMVVTLGICAGLALASHLLGWA